MGIFSNWFGRPWAAEVEAYNKAVYVLVKDLKESDAIAKTFLSSMPVESYLASIGKTLDDYDFVWGDSAKRMLKKGFDYLKLVKK